jgi:16S rRNA (uracil1498-N3)-methyltransferase
MARRRIFVESISNGSAVVAGPKAHHLHRVARLRPGEIVEVSDSRQAFVAEVKRSRAGEVEFAIGKSIETPRPAARIAAGLAICKFARLELAIEKATELGVASIVPLAAARSDKGLVQGASKRHERWERIAEEAASQSRRLAPPIVEAPVPFQQVLISHTTGLRLFLDVDTPLMKDALAQRASPGKSWEEAILLIGPEGGWTDEERIAAREAGYQAVGLGAGILRAETAAVAALAILKHWLG